MPRLFAAIDFPETLKQQIRFYIRALETCGADVRWTPAENLHLTIKFFGEVSRERLAGMEAGLRETAVLTKRFAVGLGGDLGAFPDAQTPKIIWIGVQEGVEALSELTRRVEEATQAPGLTGETREFKAHLTIGRVRSAKGIAKLREALASVRPDIGGPFEANALSLYESRTLPAGAVYRSLGSYPFSSY